MKQDGMLRMLSKNTILKAIHNKVIIKLKFFKAAYAK